jgi:hypothetical protein
MNPVHNLPYFSKRILIIILPYTPTHSTCSLPNRLSKKILYKMKNEIGDIHVDSKVRMYLKGQVLEFESDSEVPMHM